MDAPDKPVTRKCRWCGRKFKVPRDYPKRVGCPDCQPALDLDERARREKAGRAAK